MFKKFLALFTWRKRSDRGDTLKIPDAPWPRLAGHNRRIQPEQMEPFKTGTPHDRMHDLIVAGKPDALIAIELGVDISAVRNYRHIISAPARAAARKRAAESQVPHMLARGGLDEDIAAELGLDLQTVRDIRDARNHALQRHCIYANPRVPAALLRPYQKRIVDEAVRASETFGARAVTSPDDLAQALLYASVVQSSPPPPSGDISSGGGGDFGGAGATGSFSND